MNQDNINENNLEEVRIKNYSDVDSAKVQKLFQGFETNFRQKGRGGHNVSFTRKLSDGTHKDIPSTTVYPKGAQVEIEHHTYQTSENFHRESSFSKDQLPYVDLLNRLLVDLIRKDLVNDILTFFRLNEGKVGNGYNLRGFLEEAIGTNILRIINLLCYQYPNLILVIESFFMAGGKDGVRLAISNAIMTLNSDKELKKGDFVGIHPESDIKEFELMCSGMAVAFEIIKAIDQAVTELKIKPEDIQGRIGIGGDMNIMKDIPRVIALAKKEIS